MRRPPHAPFRAGAPRFTPAMAGIARAHRLSPDTEAHVLDWKAGLLDTPGRVVRIAEGARGAAREAALSVEDELGAAPTGDLVAASRLVSDDLVVMQPRGAVWICTALTLTAPTFFAIDSVFGRALDTLHGPVPDGGRLARRIARIFNAVREDQVLERFNWTLQCGPDRHTPDAAPMRRRALRIRPDEALDHLHLRVERQTISRLPHSGAVLFTIRVCLDPLSAIARGDRPALAAAWRGLGAQGRAYKGWDVLEPLADAAFERWAV